MSTHLVMLDQAAQYRSEVVAGVGAWASMTDAERDEHRRVVRLELGLMDRLLTSLDWRSMPSTLTDAVAKTVSDNAALYLGGKEFVLAPAAIQKIYGTVVQVVYADSQGSSAKS